VAAAYKRGPLVLREFLSYIMLDPEDASEVRSIHCLLCLGRRWCWRQARALQMKGLCILPSSYVAAAVNASSSLCAGLGFHVPP
jgi:hypothetical protein